MALRKCLQRNKANKNSIGYRRPPGIQEAISTKGGGYVFRQRGQSIVEFALIFPLFILLIFSVIYGGLLFADYLTLSNTARSSAREAAMLTPVTPVKGETVDYTAIKKKYTANTKLLTNLFQWQPQGTFTIEALDANKTPADSVKVTVGAVLNQNFFLVKTMNYFRLTIPDGYRIVYYMHKEK